MYVGEAVVAALEAVGQAFVVDAHLVEDGGLQIVSRVRTATPTGPYRSQNRSADSENSRSFLPASGLSGGSTHGREGWSVG